MTTNLYKYVIVTVLLVSQSAFGQGIQVDTLMLESSEKAEGFSGKTLKFPLVRTGNLALDSLISRDLVNRLTSNEDQNESLDSALIKWTSNGIVDLDFGVTYNNHGILSLNMGIEWCNAYCDYWREYFNYSTTSGKWLAIDEVIDISGELGLKIQRDKDSQYQYHIDELGKLLKEGEIDKEEHDEILERFVECDRNFMPEAFSIQNDTLKIVETCWLHHSFKPLIPTIEMKYTFEEIQSYLKIRRLLSPD